jgi:hypothetical protein
MNLQNPFAGIIARRRETLRVRDRMSTLRESLIYSSDTFFTTPTVAPNQPLNETQKIRWACHEDIILAFGQNDLEMMEAYDTHFSTTTGVRLVTICVDAIRLRGELPTGDLIERNLVKIQRINKRRQIHAGHYDGGVPEKRGGAAVLLNFMLSHPELEYAILQLVERRGIPAQDDVAPLMHQLATLPVLADGAL